jgi:hypothetical protein
MESIDGVIGGVPGPGAEVQERCRSAAEGLDETRSRCKEWKAMMAKKCRENTCRNKMDAGVAQPKRRREILVDANLDEEVNAVPGGSDKKRMLRVMMDSRSGHLTTCCVLHRNKMDAGADVAQPKRRREILVDANLDEEVNAVPDGSDKEDALSRCKERKAMMAKKCRAATWELYILGGVDEIPEPRKFDCLFVWLSCQSGKTGPPRRKKIQDGG